MSASLFIKNRQRTFSINVRHLRWMTRELLRDHLWAEDFDLAIYIVRAPEMARINQTYLQHSGSTDVITFDYGPGALETDLASPQAAPGFAIHGEIFISIDDAIAQAAVFRTTWQSELVRYVIHGILHLRGYDDLDPARRKVMKREENRLLKKLSLSHPPAKLGPGKQPRIRRRSAH